MYESKGTPRTGEPSKSCPRVSFCSQFQRCVDPEIRTVVEFLRIQQCSSKVFSQPVQSIYNKKLLVTSASLLVTSATLVVTRSCYNKCIATSNKCHSSSNKKLLVTSATLVVTSATLVVTRSY